MLIEGMGLSRDTLVGKMAIIRDPEALSTALEALTYREKTVRLLISVLEQIDWFADS